MATARNYSNTASQAQLSAAIAATDTSITLSGFSGYPVAPFTAAIARGTANEEIVLVTAVSGSTVTVTRGYDSTTAKAQGAGSTFQEVAAAIDFREANGHVVATAGVHGVAGSVVGTTDVQTLTNKTLTSPSSSNPTDTGTSTIATASITTLNVSGVSTLAGLSATTGTFSSTLAVTGAATLSSTLAVTGASTLTGLLSANGGITVPTGKVVTVTDAPAAGTSAVNKTYVDGKTWASSTISDAASAATASVVVKRDSSGRAQFADPAAAADAATKNYVDTRLPYCQIRQTAAQTAIASNAFAGITLDKKDFDSTGSMHSGTTSYVVAPVAGLYQVSGNVEWNISTQTRIGAKIQVNSVDLPGSVVYALNSASLAYSAQIPALLVHLAANDQVALLGYQNSGASVAPTVTDGASYLSLLCVKPD